MKNVIKQYFKPLIFIMMINIPPILNYLYGTLSFFDTKYFDFLNYDFSVSIALSTIIGVVYKMAVPKYTFTENLNPALEKRQNTLLENDVLIIEALYNLCDEPKHNNLRQRLSDQKLAIKKDLATVIDKRNLKLEVIIKKLNDEIEQHKQYLTANNWEENVKLYTKLIASLEKKKKKLEKKVSK